ncbi:MAG: UDP-N-acetylmuramate--L-alanine ligase [Pseudonocardiales bacterium]|nr:UDP-N-acetylmuramate--L-alanine ligase [Pseudonocardiales bacterium]MBV9029942.1 UDP-N-acetylmuramate--L-alanine ligase [Pseudonocardiales bacterium]MBW0009503.1 UDP-N-acetylmuramate--L-alanine ligase [Pseudonocardiales bacterium]
MSNVPRVDLSRPYLIGIGGTGMSGLAKILAHRGARVAGSDVKQTTTVTALRRLGCEVHLGHDPGQVLGASCVVVSQAIPEGNVELKAARENGLHVVHRAEALAAMMTGHRSVAVAGTHGKSSTTTMLAVALQRLGLDPSFAVGADLDEPGSNAHHGTGDLFVAEADESDRSFHHFRPQVGAVLNVEEDHHDHYSSLEEHIESYETFAHGIQPGGTLVTSADNAGARELVTRLRKSAPELKIITYGRAPDADVHLVKVEPHTFSSEATVRLPEGREVTFVLNVPGRHMAHNAAGALAVGLALGVAPEAIGPALGGYQGIQRRFTRRGEAEGVLVVDSYAHHPTEIAADLETARQAVGAGGRVVVVFQPHLPSRTRALGQEIGKVLASSDLVVIMEVYQGREDPIPGVGSHIVAHAALEAGAVVRREARWMAVPGVVARLVRPGDMVLTMGAGDVTEIGPLTLEEIKTRTRIRSGCRSPAPHEMT